MSPLRSNIWAAVVAALAFAAPAAHPQAPGGIPGRCVDPPQQPSEVGCYLIANQTIESLPEGVLFWHIYSYPTRAAAEAAKSDLPSAVTQSFDKAWLFTIATEQWRPVTGDRIALVGPLPTTPAQQYVARFMEATFPPNQAMKTTVHRHSGPEAWYVVAGAQCLRTPEGTMVLRAGQGGLVPPGPPMMLTSIGSEIRRAFVLVLHDASQPWQTNTAEWTPRSECPN
jgi:mannose-6-phosphate isomerase-like protein (cupin superfamily)